MPFTVQSKIKKPNKADFFTASFRNTLEHHLPYLRNHPDTERRPIDADDVYRFEGDLYGLLNHLNIDMSLHWLIMRLNKMSSPTDLGRNLHDAYGNNNSITLLIPATMLIDQIHKRFRTKRT